MKAGLGLVTNLSDVGDLTVDGNGELTANPNLPMGACGAYLQILDLTSCVPSAVVQVP